MTRVEELKRDISREPNAPDLYYELGKAFIDVDRLGEAIKVLKTAVDIAPGKSRYRLLLAKTYVKHGKYMRARRHYEAVLSNEPSNITAHMNLALMYERRYHDADRALGHYRKYTEWGGDDPSVIDRYQRLADKKGSKKIYPASPENGIADSLQSRREADRERRVRKLHLWREKMVGKGLGRNVLLKRFLFASAMALFFFQCLRTFPVLSDSDALLACMGIALLTVLSSRTGVVVGLVLMFFPIAFYSPLMGYLFVVGTFLLSRIYWKQHRGMIFAVLLMPILLKMDIAFAIPLGAALLYGARPAAVIGILASTAGLGYLAAGNIHQLGPLIVNRIDIFQLSDFAHYGETNAFFAFHWLKNLASPRVVASAQNFVSSALPALLMPPTALIQIAAWGAIGYVAGRFYEPRTPRRLAYALLASAAAVFLMQVLVVDSLPGGIHYSSWGAAGSFFLSVIAVIPIAFFTVRFYEPRPDRDEEDISWDSIAGLEDVKQEIKLALKYQFERGFSHYARRFDHHGVKGILFYGPPGCGKTLIAKVLAKDIGASFIPVKASDFRSKWYGESEKNLAALFDMARQKAPSIIFFDEIDHMLGERNGASNDSPDKGILTLFLTEMDGVQPLHNVLVVGATNEPDAIDSAALRPGRFDKLIHIPLPDEEGRKQLFHVHLRRRPLTGSMDFEKLAKMTERFSGADIADVCSKVAEQAMQESTKKGHTMKIMMAALEAQIKNSKPSVSLEALRKYEELEEKYNRRVLRARTKPAGEKEEYTWKQIGGLKHVRQEMEEAIQAPLKKPELYEKYHINPPRGVLLYGPPGCGKTLTAKIVASQCGAHFLSVDLRKETAEDIKKWFIRARENKPSVLFFDEIDSIAASRKISFLASQGVVAELLVEMDGMQELKQVVVIAATNRPDQLDGALMRPGRFDRLIYIPPPDEKSRLEILKIHFKDKPLAEDVRLTSIARKTENYSGADLAALCYEASMSLIRKQEKEHPKISMADISLAMRKVKSSIAPEDLVYFNEMKARYARC